MVTKRERSNITLASMNFLKSIVRGRFLHAGFDYGLFRLPGQNLELTADLISQQGMFTPPRHLFLHLVSQVLRVCSILNSVFVMGFMRLVTVPYLHFSCNSSKLVE